MKLLEVFRHLFHPQRSNNHRPKFLHPKPLLFLSIIAFGFYQLVGVVSTVHSVSGSILGYASNITVAQVVESTNSLRSGSGLRALSYNNQLAQAAIAKAQNMISEGYWAHTSPTGKEPWDFIRQAGYTYKVAGENLARDFDTTPPMMDAWMNSPTHRANIMNPRYENIGIAVVDGQLNGVETTLVVQMFGTPDTTVVSKPSVSVPAVASSITSSSLTTSTPVSTVSPEVIKQVVNQELESELPIPESEEPQSLPENVRSNNEVLSEARVPAGSLSNGILYSPKLVLKAFFLSIILLLVTILIYDALIAGHKNSVRFVGKNLAHIMLLITVMYLIIAFKGGVVGP